MRTLPGSTISRWRLIAAEANTSEANVKLSGRSHQQTVVGEPRRTLRSGGSASAEWLVRRRTNQTQSLHLYQQINGLRHPEGIGLGHDRMAQHADKIRSRWAGWNDAAVWDG